ncbi:hypothetical protein TMatcc_006113 [Talaromyces marneffei ATCC 18224]|uniref:Uncharacterized protein n=1 Tax=Talaromyces marneffei PM1 TaxID=1077442 RepID=A0A093UYH8_TALMA|nr:uncharacterized protein EYB26_002918 [Talaromyces marneffei]KAE8554366.1 hypothetical protein EYB25_002905 [Talaromyces marneffei]QGA15261.1 hypothetical protein EYB26_002918 [Talaromyces marneffei]
MRLRLVTLLLSVVLAFARPDDTLSTWPTIAATNSNNSECSNPRPNDCSFYAQCLQTRYNCTPSEYPLGYGQKFCEKFQADASLLSAEGQTWMEAVMLCLQRDLVPYALGGPQAFANCSALSDFAFSTHPTCYVQSGLCTLPVHDWEAIVFQIVGVESLFDSWNAIKATVEAASGCAEFYLWAIEHAIF